MFRAFDLFHQTVKLNYNESNKFSTNVGAFCTICVVIITLTQAITTFQAILGFQSPQVTIERALLENPGLLTLNSSNFHFMVNVFDVNFSSSYVSFNMYYEHNIKLENGSLQVYNINIPFKRCSADYLQKYSVTSYPPDFVNASICPDTTHIQLNGSSLQSPNYQSLTIELIKCVNDTNHPDIICKPSDEIDDYLRDNTSAVALFYSNTIMSPSNHSTPVTYYLDYATYYLLPEDYIVEGEIFINQQDLITDDNLFLEGWNPKAHTTYQIDPMEMKTKIGKLKTDASGNYHMLNLYLSRSSNKYTTKRLYPKFQQGLASVGSVFGLCKGVFGLITAFYVNRAYSLNIASQLYEFDDQNSPKIMKKRQRESSNGKLDGKEAIQGANRFGIGNNSAVSPDLQNALLSSNKQTLGCNLGDILLSFFPCIKRKRNIIIRKAMSKAAKEIDLIEILKKLQELERLKKILLDEDELRMLSYSQHPVISLQGDCEANCYRFRHTTKEKMSNKPIKKKSKADSTQEVEKSKEQSGAASQQSKGSSIQDDNLNALVSSSRSFNRLLKEMRYSPISRRILKIMDPKISDVFFDFEMKPRPPNLVTVTQVTRIQDSKVSKSPKLEAGLMIAKHLEDY